MNFYLTEYFKKQMKRISKKFPHIEDDLLEVIENLNLENETYIGRSIYKLRIKSSDTGKGKSGGMRAYVYFYIKKDLIVPMCIYAKSEVESISSRELKFHFDKTIGELFAKIEGT